MSDKTKSIDKWKRMALEWIPYMGILENEVDRCKKKWEDKIIQFCSTARERDANELGLWGKFGEAYALRWAKLQLYLQ